MRTSVRSLHFFDTRSVLLFAALTLGAGVALQARAADAAPVASTLGPLAQPAPPALAHKNTPPPMTTSPAFGPEAQPGAVGAANDPDQRPEITATMPSAARTAFDRADTDHDGQLSAKEAQMLPAISERFQQLDTNHDGMLSREEFRVGSGF